MAQVVVEMTPQEAKLWKAQQKIIAQTVDMEKGYRKVGAAGKKAGDDSAASAKHAMAAHQRVTSVLRGQVAQYVGMQAAIQLVNKSLQENKALRSEALASQVTIATSQQEAIKNLTGMTTAEKQEVLQKDVPAIQVAVGFPDQAPLIDAIGAGFSASGDIEATKSAVEAAARLTILTPEAVSTVSAGALDVSRGSGIKDAERNIGFLLSAGSINRIEDPTALAKNLAPLVSSGVASVPGQDKQDASREIGALFGVLARAATDTKGESTGTAAVTLLAKLDKFFSEPPERKEGDKTPERPADPGTVFGRIELIQKDEALRKELLGDEGFGEAKFKKAIAQILTAGTDVAGELRPAKEQVVFDANVFRQTAEEVTTATPQIRNAVEQARSKANIQGLEQDESTGREAATMTLLAETLRKTRPKGEPAAFVGEWLNTMAAEMGFRGDTPESRAINILEQRKEVIQDQGFANFIPFVKSNLTADDRTKLDAIDTAIGQLKEVQSRTPRERAEPFAAMPAPVVNVASPTSTQTNTVERTQINTVERTQITPGQQVTNTDARFEQLQQDRVELNTVERTNESRVENNQTNERLIENTAVEHFNTERRFDQQTNNSTVERFQTEQVQVERLQVDRTESANTREINNQSEVLTERVESRVERELQQASPAATDQSFMAPSIDTRGLERAIEQGFVRAVASLGNNTGLQHGTPPPRRLNIQTTGLANAQRAQAAVPA